ncbi:uncharacterized protein LOC132311740 isoform X2 [Cornus florida]|uniref:uncharacterized protein LOC132311740 isoform X2 n=1 Tax=Cornus florida TaxID=4283 RepID=UPI002897226A|nr:uncharacterized protein LOC132311740 isoform X2 [Cornus florida]
MEERGKKDDVPSARFTWTIKNFSRLMNKKLYSPSFYVGGYKWRVLLFPKGNHSNHLSMYLDPVDSTTLQYGWGRISKFSLSVINQIYSNYTRKKDFQLNAKESEWGASSFVPLSELYDRDSGYIVNDKCIVEVDIPGFCSVELEVEAAKTASGKGETPKSSSQGDIKGRIRLTAFGTNTILPQTDTSGPPPSSKSATEAMKTSVPPTTPIVEKESTVNSSLPQDPISSFSPEVELLRGSPMGSPLESSSFDDMDAYISKLVSIVKTDAPFDTSDGSVAASTPQSIDEVKTFFIKMLSLELSEIPDFYVHLTESICVLLECCDLTPDQLAELNTFKVEFSTLIKTYQTSSHSLKKVEEKMAEKEGTKKSLVEQVKINAFTFQMQRGFHKDLISKEGKLQQEVERLQAELAKISEKKMSAEKVVKQLHGKMVNIERSRSSVLEEISTLETEKKTAESSLSSAQQKWTKLRNIFMEPDN